MAELATLARPYAEALFRSAGSADSANLSQQLQALAAVAADAQLLQFAQDPRNGPQQTCELMQSVLGQPLLPVLDRLLLAIVENGRLAALPAIAAQFQALMDTRAGVHQAQVHTAYALSAEQLSQMQGHLERRFGRRLSLNVAVDPELIGGVRVAVGDEVFDTSVRAQLERMKATLLA